jgi:tartrate-resistant acid phosphatase type 5
MTSILCVGNFGTGKKEQIDVAELLCYLCRNANCKLILGLGNNIYPDGVTSVNDNQFLEKFEIPYSVLPNNIKFYQILGNKDYHMKSSVRSQINYHKSGKSFRWIMPFNFYCFTKKFEGVPVEFIALDTNLDKMKNRVSQEKWAINSLYESKARWRIVFGHHPWTAFGIDGKKKHTSDELDTFYKKLVDTGKVDLIISGHENSQQHIYIPERPDMLISGVGGYKHKEEDVEAQILLAKELQFKSLETGCVKIDVFRDYLLVEFYNTDKQILYTFKIKKV